MTQPRRDDAIVFFGKRFLVIHRLLVAAPESLMIQERRFLMDILGDCSLQDADIL